MRALIIAGLIIVVLIVIGAVYFQSSDGKVTITIDTDKMKQATEKVVESGKELLNKAEQSLKRE